MRAAIVLAMMLLAGRAEAQAMLGDPQQRDSFYDDVAPDTCHAARDIPIHPGYFAPIGSLGRDVEIEAGIGSNGDVLAGTLGARVIPVRFNRYLSLLVGASTAVAHRVSLDTTTGSSPLLELGVTARSECDRWNVLATVSYAAPDPTLGTPSDWQTTIPSVLVDPWNALLYLPVSGIGGVLATFDARVRTDGDDVFGAFRFGFRGGTTQVGSQYGVLAGFTGALMIEAALALRRVWHVPINLALAARLTVDLSAFWPANAVGPMAITFPLRWSPDRAIAMEIWAGYAMFLVGTAADLPHAGGTYGLRVTTYIDL